MSAPAWGPLDPDTADLLSLISDDPRVGHDWDRFVMACESVARRNNGLIYVNEVRRLLTDDNGDLMIRPQRLSSFWSKATNAGLMVKTGEWQVCKGSASGNDGRPQPVRRWVA